MTNLNDFTFIDLFAGIGGIRQGFQKAGGTCVMSSEKDKFCQQTYFANYDEIPLADIETITTEMVPNHQILCAGFPCQPFSAIGRREGFEHATQGTMFHEILRIANAKNTPILFLENVTGLITHDKGNTLKTIVDSLVELNYNVVYRVYDARDFGVPQSRKRVYIVASKKDLPKFTFSEPPLVTQDIGEIVETGVEGYELSESMKKYLFKFDDGNPQIIDNSSKGVARALTACYHKVQRKTGTFVADSITGLRKLSENECKAIMGFPSDFKFPVSRTQMYRQMGNSVVIPVVEFIAKDIVNQMTIKKPS